MKYIYIILALALIASCGEEELRIYDDNQVGLDVSKTNLSFLASGDNQPKNAGIKVQLIAQPRTTPTNVNFEVGAESTAIEGLHYNISGTSASIPAGENTAELPIAVLVDNFGAGESVSLNLRVTGGDNATLATYATDAVYTITVLCSSELEGTYAVSSVGQGSWGCTATYTGTVKWVKTGDGSYDSYTVGVTSDVKDLSFGSYIACYGYAADASAQGSFPNGSVQLNDECNKLFFSGTSQWDEIYSINSVSTSGSELIIDWGNDYGEGAISTFTRTDGTSWPNLGKK